MPNILILGATGYIGRTLCLTLVRSGAHTVYGLARSPSSAKTLKSIEVIPVSGSVDDSACYLSLIHSAPIDIVVDCSGANDGSTKVLKDVLKAGETRLQKAKEGGIKISKLGFIYLSGVWVHGSSPDPVTDLVPVGTAMSPNPPASIVAWRPVLEHSILAASDVLDVTIVRAGLVYGRENTIWTALLAPLAAAGKSKDKTLKIEVNKDAVPALCHVDDIAEGLHCAIDKLQLISGTNVYPVFDLITSQEPMREILEAAGKVLGFEGDIEMVGAGENVFMQAMCTTINGSSARAKSILEWEPKRFGYVQHMNVVAGAWEATQK